MQPQAIAVDSAVPVESTVADTKLKGAGSVLAFSSIGFTLLFAVWLMFGVLAVPIKEEFKLSPSQFAWLTAIAILNGSIWRLPFGILADRYGGKKIMMGLLLFGSVASYMVSTATTFTQLMVYAFLVGVVGNSFSVGISWNSAWFTDKRKGLALGTFGAGNVGASVTKLIGPALIAMVPAAGLLGGVLPGGWRFVPVMYSILLAVMAVLMWFCTPSLDRCPGSGRPMAEMLKPIRNIRVWCFGLYYVVVFGAYVALSLILPNYYKEVYHMELKHAAWLTALFIFPASLLRPVGGWLSDKFGPVKVTYGVFIGMLLACLPLALPSGSLGFEVDVTVFTIFMCLVGVFMGIGKAAVYKYIADVFPKDVGAVGGLVGSLGALGGFVLPLASGYLTEWTGKPNATFFMMLLLIASSFVWLHLVVTNRDKIFSDHIIPVIVGIGSFLGIWVLASVLSKEMPGPLATISLLYGFVKENFWGGQNRVGIPLLLLFSLTRVMTGFLIGAIVAIPLGFLVGTSPFIQRMFNPFIELFRPISPLAWYPVALVMFSAPSMQNAHFKPPTMASIFVIFICSLWPTVLNTAMGVTQTNKDYLNVARMLRLNQWQVFRQIYWPAALPSIVTGLRISLGIAWMVIVAAEMLNGQDGIGFFCWDQYNAGSVDRSILAMLLIGVVGLILNVIMVKFEKMVKY